MIDGAARAQQLAATILRLITVDWQHRLMRRVDTAIRDEVRLEAPEREGELKRGIKFTTGPSGTYGRIYSEAPHSGFVFFGTPTHTIWPKSKKALSFLWGGKRIVVRRVQHPGTRPNRFMIRGLVGSRGKRQQIYQEEARRAIREGIGR